ncbi:UNVERIFIED_CONTAM: hypothetical protein Sradi_4886700 [Sesamum radiatum]|uniref:DUF4283 domain-containing protein n=1 Tax=Sesamum radiatum TaxID=300843 RepID=A0AAW2MC55_SESRA
MRRTFPLKQFEVSLTRDVGLSSRPSELLAVDSPSSERISVADHHQSPRLVIPNLLSPAPTIFIKPLRRYQKIAPPLFAVGRTTVSPPSDGGLLAEKHCWTRLSMAHPPVRSKMTVEASSDVPPLAANSDELSNNSAESTQSSLPVQQQQKLQQNPNKSFAEILTGSNKQRYDDIQKFFLANSTPTKVGTRVDIDGRPTLIFNDMETLSFAATYRYALVGKFSHGAPQYRNLHRLIAGLGIKGAFTISMINAKHVLISLSNEADLSHLWLRRIWHVQGFPMRVFIWTPTFTPEQESSIVPVWVCFPELPAHFFHKDALFAVASMIGTPLQIDDFTFNHSRLSKARVGIEINLTKPLVEDFDLKINGITIRQKVEYEQVPKYCNLCKHVGHDNLECYSKGNAPRPPQRKGKKVAKHLKSKEKMTTNECVIMEKGECSKSTEDGHKYVSETVEINHADNDILVAENDDFAAENENSVAKKDSIRVIENVVELDGSVDDRNDTLDGETIDVASGGGPVATKGMEIQLFYQAIKPIVPDRKGKSLKQMKTEEVCRLFNKLKHFGAVCHAINYAESDEEEHSRALLTGPKFDTEEVEQGIPSRKKPSPIASRTRCRKKRRNPLAVRR